MAVKEIIKDFARWFTAPLSGTKRRRDDGLSKDQDQGRIAPAVRAGEATITGIDGLKSSENMGEPAVGEPMPSVMDDPRQISGHPSTSEPERFTFDLADRLRQLEPAQPSADRFLPLGQPPRQSNTANQNRLGPRPGSAGQRRVPYPASRATNQPRQPQEQVPSLLTHGTRTALQLPAQRGLNMTPVGGSSAGAEPRGYSGATPKQLFATPESARRHFDNLRLGGSTPSGFGGTSATSINLSCLGTGMNAGTRKKYSGLPAKASTADTAAGMAGPDARGPMGYRVPTPMTGMGSGCDQAPLPYQGYQPPHQTQQPRVPFHASFMMHMRELGANVVKTNEDLRAMLKEFEAGRARYPAAVPLREDGGYIPGDDEEAGAKTVALGNDVRASIDRLRHAMTNAMRKVTHDPRVAAAAGSRQVAQTALEASEAAAGASALAAIGLKVAAQEQAVKRIREQVEAETLRKLQALQAEQAARRAQLEEQYHRIRQGLVLLQPQGPAAAAAAASTAAAASISAAAQPPRSVPALTAGKGRAGPVKAKQKPPPEDDIVDLLSSDEEDLENEEKEGVQEDEDEAYKKYAVEYGEYPGEQRGGGNTALRLASRAERAIWRRTMDPHADLGELMVDFRPNNVSVIDLPRAKLQCMDLGVWLNDEVINLYMLLLQARDTRLRQAARPGCPPAPRCHFFNSFFYNKLFQDEGRYNYSNVRRWTIPKQLANKLQASSAVLKVDRIIIPIHRGVHWTCAEVDLKAHAVRYYDSLKGEDRALMQHLLSWVSDEAADKFKERWDTSKWSVEFPKNIPEQLNGCDCGVFSIMFADYLGTGQPFDFSQRDMPLLRIKVLNRIVQMRVD